MSEIVKIDTIWSATRQNPMVYRMLRFEPRVRVIRRICNVFSLKSTFPHRIKAMSCFFAWLFLSGIAFGQYGYNFAWTTTQQAWITGVVDRNLMDMKALEPSKVKSKLPKSLSALTFTPLAGTRSATIRHMCELLAQGNAEKARSFEEDINKRKVLNNFSNLMVEHKFMPNNVADFFSTYVILTWQIFTGKDATQNMEGVRLYRDAVREAMLKNGKIETLGKKDRQVICEKMAIFVYMVTTVVSGGREPNVLEGIRKTTLQITGIDVAAYDLTDKGFMKRKDG